MVWNKKLLSLLRLATFIKKFDAHLHEHGFERGGRVDDIKGHPQGEIRGLTKLVKITEDVRKFAARQKIFAEKALQVGLKQKAREFVEKGSELYIL